MEKFTLIIISGAPEYGKSRFATLLSRSISIPYLSLDKLFENEVFPRIDKNLLDKFKMNKQNLNQKVHFSISKYLNSDFFNFDLFYNKLIKKIYELLNYHNSSTLIIDGFLGNQYTKFFSMLDNFEKHEVIFYEKYLVKMNSKHFNTQNYLYFNLISEIKNSFDYKCANIVKHTNYQSFIGTKDSDSLKKLHYLNLSTFLHRDDKLLDIGCNLGYFCFKAAKISSNSIFGIDFNENSINQAKYLRDYYFKKFNCKFLNIDFFEFNIYSEHEKFNVIVCLSTFHYFGNRYQNFFSSCYALLFKSGILILEIELCDSDEDVLLESKRKMDFYPCIFPSLKKLHKLFNRYFTVLSLKKSVFQKGSLYDRYVIHLSKK